MQRTCLRLLQLYLPWFLIFLMIDLATGAPHSFLELVRRFAGFSDKNLETTGFHLWFLPSLMLAQLTSWLSIRWLRSLQPVLWGGLALYAGMAYAEMRGVALPFGMAPHEGLNLSLLCVSLGALFGAMSARKKISVPAYWVWIALFSVPMEGLILDRLQTTNWTIHAFQVSRVLLPAILLGWLNESPNFGGEGRIGRALDFLGEHSTGVYVAHVAFLVLLPFETVVTNGFVRDNLVRWPVAIAGSIMLSIAIKRLNWGLLRGLVG